MPSEEWGTKRLCPVTGRRFYDLNRSPVISPYTGEVVDIESARRKLAATVVARAAPDKAGLGDDDTDDDLLDRDEGAADDIDDELLDDDGDDNVALDDIADVAKSEDDG